MHLTKSLGAIVLTAALALTGCSSQSNEPAAPETTSSPDPQPSPTEPVQDRTPLALVNSKGNSDGAATFGVLSVNAGCTHLVSDAGATFLIWPSGQTRWDADNNTVVFTSAGGEEVILHDGDEITVGGSGGPGGDQHPDWQDSLLWEQNPLDECRTDSWWVVGDVSL